MPDTDPYKYLLDLPRFARQGEAAYAPGLERIEAVLAEMGNPQRAFEVVHVAGTNGKGSTASMLAAILTAYGYRTGLHTSPHLMDVTERMRIDGTPVPEEWLADAVEEWRPVFDRYRPSFFEATVALSFLYFARRDVEWAAVEVGMGGRLDATNVVSPEMAVITHIGLDHTQWLGESIREVAREKAGIIKEGVLVCVGQLPPEALEVVQEVARARGARLHVVPREVSVTRRDAASLQSLHVESPGGSYENLIIDLPGRHQQANSLLALRGAELILPANHVRKRAILEGLAHVSHLSGLRARLEVVSEEPPILVDVAHNEDSLAVTLEALEERRTLDGRFVVALGVMTDKDVRAMGALLREVDAEVWPVVLEEDRAMRASALGTVLEEEGVTLVERGGGDITSAVHWFRRHARPGDLMLATGSHRVAAALIQEVQAANA